MNDIDMLNDMYKSNVCTNKNEWITMYNDKWMVCTMISEWITMYNDKWMVCTMINEW